MTADPDIAVVREALDQLDLCGYGATVKASRAALDRLEARLRETEDALEAAEATLEADEGERRELLAMLDDAREEANGWRACAEDADGNLFCARAEAAESRVAVLEAALAFYADPMTYTELSPDPEWGGTLDGPIPIRDYDNEGDRARRALAAEETK